jgi:hypothetical protein
MSNESRLTESEIAWCAGLFEGEGNIGSQRKPGLRHKGGMTPRLQFASTDLDVVQKFHAFMGGKIRGPYQGRPTEKPYWRWDTNAWSEFVRVGSLIRPWLCSRRGARYDYVLSLMPDHFRKPFAYKPCDYPPTPSIAGYLKHRRAGEQACEVCMESYRLYQRPYQAQWKAKQPKREPKPRVPVDHCSKPVEASQAGRSIHTYRGTPICDRCAESYRLWYQEFRAKRRSVQADS